MKKLLLNLGTVASLMLALVSLPVLSADSVMALPADQVGDTVSVIQNSVNKAGGSGQPGLMATVKKIVNILLFIVGAIAVLMIIIGGLRYVLSAGDSGATTSAKNTVLYAVIGLAVAFMAYAIVNFVVGKL